VRQGLGRWGGGCGGGHGGGELGGRFLERERVNFGIFRREKRKKKWRREKEVAGPLLGGEGERV